MAGTIFNTITRHKRSFGPADPGGDRMIIMTGIVTMRSDVADLSGGTCVLGSPTITALSTATNYRIGDYVYVTEGFPSASTPYKIIGKTAHTSSTSDDATLTLDTNAVTGSTDVGVGIPVQILDLSEDIPNLEKVSLDPVSGYVFGYDYSGKKIVVYVQNSLSDGALTATTAMTLSGVQIPYIAWGY